MKKIVLSLIISFSFILSSIFTAFSYPLVSVDNANELPHWVSMPSGVPSQIVSYDDLVNYHSYLISIGVPCNIVYNPVPGSSIDYYYIQCTSAYDVSIGGSTQSTMNAKGLVAGIAVQSGSSFSYVAIGARKYIQDTNTWQPFYTILSDINSLILDIENDIDSIDGSINNIESMLTSSLPALFTTQTGQGTLSVAELQYKVWQAVDGLESSVSSIDSKLSTTNTRLLNIYNRLAKTVSGTTYTAADLLYNVWQQTKTNGGYVDGVEGSLNDISGYVDGVEGSLNTISGYVDGIEGKLDSVQY